MRLFVVRHGQVEANRELRYVGSLDQGLTEEGLGQAGALALTLARIGFARVVSSPLARGRATAQAIADALALPVEVDARLREQSFGDWEGSSRSEIIARGPEHEQHLLAFDRDPAVAPPGGGESLAAVGARVRAFVEEQASSHRDASPLVVVSHVGPIKSLLALALGVSILGVRRLFLDPGTLSVVDWGPTPIVRLVNAPPGPGIEHARFLR